MKLQTVCKLLRILMSAVVSLAILSWLSKSLVFVILLWGGAIAAVVLDWGFWRCPYCGRYLGRLNIAFCPHCGNELFKK